MRCLFTFIWYFSCTKFGTSQDIFIATVPTVIESILLFSKYAFDKMMLYLTCSHFIIQINIQMASKTKVYLGIANRKDRTILLP